MALWVVLGAALGVLCLLPFLKSPTKALTSNGYMALAMMLMIYLGAYLVSGSTERVIYETLFAIAVLALASFFKKTWPLGIALLVFLHGSYDHFFGAQSGVAEWYPPACAGFDMVVGLGLGYLILKNNKRINGQNNGAKS
ncbi:MAG: hypothetical protein ACPGVT_11195 [Maricaulaceae bacterium]